MLSSTQVILFIQTLQSQSPLLALMASRNWLLSSRHLLLRLGFELLFLDDFRRRRSLIAFLQKEASLLVIDLQLDMK